MFNWTFNEENECVHVWRGCAIEGFDREYLALSSDIVEGFCVTCSDQMCCKRANLSV